MSLVATEPQPALAWSFESSNVDYITGLSPNLSTAGTYAAPTGGTITTVSGKRIHTFTTVGTTSITFLVPVTIQVLVIGAGAGGGANNGAASAGGGGGAGEMYYNAAYTVGAGTYTITVGAGGAGGVSTGARDGVNGGASVFDVISANGGGGGGANGGANGADGLPGGSGGGAARGTTANGGVSVKTASGLGNKGGEGGAIITGAVTGAGGGGAGSAGTDASTVAGTTPIPGGTGSSNSISGAAVTYASGGTGGSRNGTYTPSGGTFRGDGGDGAPAGTGTAVNGAGGNNGIVIISYNAALYPAPTYVAGKYNQAINFDNQTAGAGANSFVSYDVSSFNLTSNSATLSLWLNPSYTYPLSAGSNPYYISLQGTTYYSFQTEASLLSNISLHTGSSPNIVIGRAAQSGVWNHYCGVFSNVGTTGASNTASYFYLNGVLIGSANTLSQSFTDLYLACSSTIQRGAWCSIDDLRVYNTALTAAQVQSVYNQQGVPGRFVFSLPSTPSSSMAGAPLFSQLSAAAASSAVGAFSLRAVNGVTAKAVQIKRSSDSATQDFWADSQGNLLTVPIVGTTLANWLSGASGNVVTWYDQTGLGNHATQATAANQPTINLSNVTVSFNGNQWVSNATPTGMFIPLYQNTYSIVTKHRQWTAGGAWGTGNTASFANGTFNGLRWSTGSNYQNFIGGGFLTFGPQPGTYPVVATVVNNRTTDIGYINGTQSSTGVVNPTIDPVYSQFIGQAPNGGNMIGELNALFFFKSAISTADRTIVESLI